MCDTNKPIYRNYVRPSLSACVCVCVLCAFVTGTFVGERESLPVFPLQRAVSCCLLAVRR